MTLRQMMYDCVKLADGSVFFAKTHQEILMMTVEVVGVNIQEAEHLITMINKQPTVLLTHYQLIKTLENLLSTAW